MEGQKLVEKQQACEHMSLFMSMHVTYFHNLV